MRTKDDINNILDTTEFTLRSCSEQTFGKILSLAFLTDPFYATDQEICNSLRVYGEKIVYERKNTT